MPKEQILSREEILKDCLQGYLLKIEDINHGTTVIPAIIYKAMDILGKQQSIAFGEWLNESNWGEKETWGKYDPPSMPTTEQLYDLFEQSQSKK